MTHWRKTHGHIVFGVRTGLRDEITSGQGTFGAKTAGEVVRPLESHAEFGIERQAVKVFDVAEKGVVPDWTSGLVSNRN